MGENEVANGKSCLSSASNFGSMGVCAATTTIASSAHDSTSDDTPSDDATRTLHRTIKKLIPTFSLDSPHQNHRVH